MLTFMKVKECFCKISQILVSSRRKTTNVKFFDPLWILSLFLSSFHLDLFILSPNRFWCNIMLANFLIKSLIHFHFFLAGLFKGSVTPHSQTAPHYAKIEKPATFGQFKNVCSPNDYVVSSCQDSSENDYSATVRASSSGGSTAATNKSVVTTSTNGTDKSSSMSFHSPFDEQEEWAKISEIMASFSNGIDQKSIVSELEQEFESRLGNSFVYYSVLGGIQKPWKWFFSVTFFFPFPFQIDEYIIFKQVNLFETNFSS